MAKKNYEEMATRLIDLVGGKDNVTNLAHCITRLRFNLKDRGIPNTDEIKKVSGVVGAQWSGEQLQIIIGQDVGKVYDKICQQTNLEKQQTINENLDGDSQRKKFKMSTVFEAISGCLVPVLPVLMGGAFVKVLIILLSNFNLISTASNTYFVLNFAASASTYFLPVLLGASAAKKFNTNIYLGVFMGAILLAPDFVAAGSAGTAMSLFGIPITYLTYGYGGTIFPIIMIVFVMSYVEKFWKKISPNVLRSILVPFGTIVVMLPIALSVLGPLGQFIGDVICKIVAFIYDRAGFLAVAIVASLYPLLVMTGMHMSLMPIRIQYCTTMGFDPIIKVASTISNYNQGIACLGIALRTKDQDLKATAFGAAASALLGGISEPALFGVTLPYKRPLYASMIGSCVGGLIAGLFGTVAYLTGGTGLFALTAFIGERAHNLLQYLIALIAGMVVTFVLSYLFGVKEDPKDGTVSA
ncbi:MAG: PTS transporter subunit EIIC [Faecousia sp.]